MSLVGKATDSGLFAHYFRNEGRSTRVQFVRYGFVAVVAFVADFGTLAVLGTRFGVNYLLAAAIGFSFGLIVNYVLSSIWVFQGYGDKNHVREFTVFLITGLVGLWLTELLMWGFTSRLGYYFLVSKILTSFIVIIWNFFARKIVLYR